MAVVTRSILYTTEPLNRGTKICNSRDGMMVINTLVIQETNFLFCLPALSRTWLGHLTLNLGYYNLCQSVFSSKPEYTVCQ